MSHDIQDDRLLFTILEKIEDNITELRETASELIASDSRLNERILKAELSIDDIRKEIKYLNDNKERTNYFYKLTAQNSRVLRIGKKILKWLSIIVLTMLVVEIFIAFKTGLLEVIITKLLSVLGI